MPGMLELFFLVKLLEGDWHAVFCGFSIAYGSQKKSLTNISQSMGVPKKRKQAYEANDSWKPDTTEARTSDKMTQKLGKPPGAQKINILQHQ